MKKILCVIFLSVSLLPLGAMAQRTPNNEEILAQTIDATSQYYYPNLIDRYVKGDSTLTANDYFYLYYGYMYQDSYKPLEAIPVAEQLLSAVSASGSDRLQLYRVIEYAIELMNHDPFSPTTLNCLVYAYGALGDNEKELQYFNRLSNVLATIAMSGDGEREESAWHVLYLNHAYDFLAARGAKAVNSKRTQNVISSDVVYLALTEKDANNKRGYYVDYGRMYMKRPENIPQRPRTWRFNNLPIKERK